MIKVKRALISVSEKKGIVPFARGLNALGVEILSTGGTAKQLKEAGIPVRDDNSPAHMHHKFALFDRKLLLTGSYNWTRSAGAHNHENLIVSSDPRLVGAFNDMFDRLWHELEAVN